VFLRRLRTISLGENLSNPSNTYLHKLPVMAVHSGKACHGLQEEQWRNIICLKENGGKGLCDGDSGGPLVCEGRKLSLTYITRIHSMVYLNYKLQVLYMGWHIKSIRRNTS
jgi:hypothetical protein